MTYLDLLKYLIDVQKIEKEDLAELIGIPQKKIESVLAGAVPLKKKWIKNLSLYTGIPTESIVTGNFVLNYPAEAQEPQVIEGEAPAVSKLAPEMENNMKQYNYERFLGFCKDRYKKRYRDVTQAVVVQVAFCILNLILSLTAAVFIYAQTPMTNIWLLPLTCFVPTIIPLASSVKLFKIAKSGIKSEEKNFKIYSSFPVLSMLVYTVAAVCFKIFPVWALGIAAASVLPIIYFVFVKGVKEKSFDITFISGAVFSYAMALALPFSVLAGDFLDRDVNAIVMIAYMAAFVATWLVVAMALFCVSYDYFCYKKVIGVSKYFEPLPEKTLFKKHHLRNKIIAVVLAAIIFTGGTYILSCTIMYLNVTSVINYDGYEAPEYSEYNKQTITFTEADDVTTIETEFYTVKIPADLKKNEKITTQDSYNSDPAGGIVLIYTQENLYGTLGDMYDGNDISELDEKQAKVMGELKQELIDTYGFFPQTAYQLKRITKDVRENGVSFFNRKKAAAVVPIVIFDTTLSYEDEIIFYEDEEKELVLSVRRNDFTESDSSLFSCSVHGNKKGEYEKFIDITIMIRSEYSEEDLAYKIINSIEMK